MANENATIEKKQNVDDLDFDELEEKLQDELESELGDLSFLDEQRSQIRSPDALGEVVLNTVWEQFTNQIAIQAGEDFIKANNGLHLDLRDEAHIQTAERFAEGKIATHNTEIDYQDRYDKWQSKFERDEQGNIKYHETRIPERDANGNIVTDATGNVVKKKVETLKEGYRDPYDKERNKRNLTGSKEKGTAMDETVSVAEIERDPAANAFMTQEERIEFDLSDKNLNEIPSAWNSSKGDTPTDEWLDNPNSKGQTPREIFDDMDEASEEQLRKKNAEAREEYEKQKKEAEKQAVKAGKKSQKAEALRIGKKAARAVIMNLLADLVKKIIRKLIAWIKSKEKNLKSLLVSIKDAIIEFVLDLKTHVVNVADTAVTVIATSILGPVVGTIKKAWIFIKQGWSSLKQSVEYIRNPENKGKPIGILLMEVGKIITAGMTAVGAIALGEVIEVGLSTIPIFAFEIPLFGSLANIIGIFLGAVVSGIIGALALNLINSLIAKRQKAEITKEKVNKGNEILATQEKLMDVSIQKVEKTKADAADSIKARHKEASGIMRQSLETIQENSDSDFEDIDNSSDFHEMDQRIKRLSEE